MDIFTHEFIANCVVNKAVTYEINNDNKTESMYLTYKRYPADGNAKKAKTEKACFFHDVPVGTNWMMLMDFDDSKDKVTESVLGSLKDALNSLEFPSVTSRSSLTNYFKTHSKEFYDATEKSVLKTIKEAVHKRPALALYYPPFVWLLGSLHLYYSGNAAIDELIELTNQNAGYLHNDFDNIHDILSDAHQYVCDVFIVPGENKWHMAPRTVADHYRNLCQAERIINYYEKYNNTFLYSVPKLDHSKSFTDNWTMYMDIIHAHDGDNLLIMSVSQYLHLGIEQLFDSGSVLRKCGLCGNYFRTTYTSRQLYCTRQYKDTEFTCSNYASRNNFKIKAKNDVIAAEYTRAYNQLYGRIRNGKVSPSTPLLAALKSLYTKYRGEYDGCDDSVAKEQIFKNYSQDNRKLLARS